MESVWQGVSSFPSNHYIRQRVLAHSCVFFLQSKAIWVLFTDFLRQKVKKTFLLLTLRVTAKILQWMWTWHSSCRRIFRVRYTWASNREFGKCSVYCHIFAGFKDVKHYTAIIWKQRNKPEINNIFQQLKPTLSEQQNPPIANLITKLMWSVAASQ